MWGDNLPQGLRTYSRRHWRQMQDVDNERFRTLFEPALRLLASAHEPVSLESLSSWSGASLVSLREVIVAWRQFLTESQIDGERRYSVYHASFRDFLPQEGVELQPSHARIAQTILDMIRRV
jgi:hypothetical protein